MQAATFDPETYILSYGACSVMLSNVDSQTTAQKILDGNATNGSIGARTCEQDIALNETYFTITETAMDSFPIFSWELRIPNDEANKDVIQNVLKYYASSRED